MADAVKAAEGEAQAGALTVSDSYATSGRQKLALFLGDIYQL